MNAQISIFLPDLGGGGAERAMLTLASSLSARGYRVDIILICARGEHLGSVPPSIRVIDLKATRAINALLPLARYLRRDRPEVLLAIMTHLNIVALLARNLAMVSTRIVVSERNTISVEHAHSEGMVAKFIYRLVPYLYPKANRICTVSHGVSDDLVRFADLPASIVTTIYNPFDLKYIESKAAEHNDHPWFLPGLPPVILAIGRLTEQKDYPTLIRAFARLRATRTVRLLILGEGPLRGSLEALVQDCLLTTDDVQLHGFDINPFSYLARCNLFVLSSAWEGLPGVLIEALACGAPVVSTDCPSGPREILECGKWGGLVPVGDSSALANRMACVLDTPRELLPDVRKRAMDFGQEIAINSYLNILGFRQ